ncbi:unnamed protein product [Cylicostephanus goldi]|uniref:Uncharacterized protein n=1 Tax=Cylicostephanus goldi TaxID=71465 RepID=A0A3P6R5V3_CYLGO|nr:unnamed protein product [Cylicostephanus goldi]
MTGLFYKGYRKTLEVEDMFEPLPEHESAAATERLTRFPSTTLRLQAHPFSMKFKVMMRESNLSLSYVCFRHVRLLQSMGTRTRNGYEGQSTAELDDCYSKDVLERDRTVWNIAIYRGNI